MISYGSNVVFLSLDHMCSVVHDVNAKNNDDISIPVPFPFYFWNNILVLCFLPKCGGFYVYKFIVDFQVSVDFFGLKSVFLNFF